MKRGTKIGLFFLFLFLMELIDGKTQIYYPGLSFSKALAVGVNAIQLFPYLLLTCWINKLECLSVVKYLSSEIRLGSRDRIDITSFSSYLTNWPNRLECYITIVWKCFRDKHASLLGLFASYK